MASSMTGLGTGEIAFQKNTICVEVKSFNNRYLEVSLRLVPQFTPFEREIKELVRKHIQRGKLYLSVSLSGDNPGQAGLRVNSDKVKAVHRLLREVQKTAGTRETLKLDHYLKFSEILEPDGNFTADEEVWQFVRQAVEKALVQLKTMRDQEGAILAVDLARRIRVLEERVGTIEILAKERAPETLKRMRERLQQLMQDAEIDENRLLLEIALLSDRMDITEECVRLKSHAEVFLGALDRDSGVGKKLTFLLQEMNREVNTICAKASSADISHLAVDMKDEIEKLREQVQNLE
jgi:uncharacterized protein (TIGR00255 family)